MFPIQTLPPDFLTRMESMLGSAYPDFLASFDKPRRNGLRVNALKITPKRFRRLCPFPLKPIPWTENGFFYEPDVRPAASPLYRLGLYYLQEPSAMAPASLLPVEPGDKVLDLCAAPGGKSTELGARLKGQGLLVSNDLSGPRCKALLRNLEQFGVSNGFIVNESPQRLTPQFPEFFDKILVDAPCSGEGMFRKEPAAIKTWSLEKSLACAKLQREILTCAIQMLAPGGLLMYSTCTFAAEENEGAISYILENHPEMDLAPLSQAPNVTPDFSPGNPLWGNGDPRLERCLRLWPHRCPGEGHFLALLRKDGCRLSGEKKKRRQKKAEKISRSQRLLLEEFLQPLLEVLPEGFSWDRVEIRADSAYLLPAGLPPVKGLRFLRNGLFLGQLKKNRFEPSQPLALALTGAPSARLDIPSADPRIQCYLQGESIPTAPGESTVASGWAVLCADGFPLGWGKLVNGTFKNKYPGGWR